MDGRALICRVVLIRRGLSVVTAIICAVSLPVQAVDFNRDIRPILSNNCFACHGPDTAARQADLRLDIEKYSTAEHHGHAAIVPGNLGQSERIQRITSNDADERMPPKESNKHLKPQEIELLKQWVKEGAKWSLPWSYIPPHDT